MVLLHLDLVLVFNQVSVMVFHYEVILFFPSFYSDFYSLVILLVNLFHVLDFSKFLF